MTIYTIDEHMSHIEKWLVTGELDETMLGENFQFTSPFWESNDKQAFLDKFKDPTDYKEKSLSNIVKYDPFIRLKSDDRNYFALVFQYHTKYNIGVDETVLGKVENGLLVELKSIYDLERTKKAHHLK